jgi:hypothetical protein
MSTKASPQRHRPDRPPAKGRLADQKCLCLLVVLILLMLLHPFLATSMAGRLTLNILNSAALVLAVYALHGSRRQLAVAVCLMVPTLAGQWFILARHDTALLPALGILAATFYAFIAASILRYVLRAGEVTTDRIYGAVCAYLLIALTWALVYIVIERLCPGSFAADVVHNPKGRMDVFDMLYYSVVTLTTSGFGDITPVSTYARAMTNVEQLVGVFYVAILIARLTGLYTSRNAREAVRRETADDELPR